MDLIVQGRVADVYDIGGGRVLRRYRDGRGSAPDARLLQHLEVLGYPVPHVYDVDGADLVMERVDGGTLFHEMMHEPGQFRRYGRLLGELHERLHRLDAPDWLDSATDGAGTGKVGTGAVDAAEAPVIVHRALHPRNVILSERGPLVIDWSAATAGRAEVDAAITVLVLLGSEIDLDASTVERLEPFRGMLVDAFLETCGVDPRDGLEEAIAYRLSASHGSPSEERWLSEEAPDCLDAFYLEPRAV